MDKYTTIMIIPEKAKKVRSFRIPRPIFRSLSFLFVVFHVFIAILAYDYWQILQQVYENKYLTVENRQLKDQLQLFQVKLDTLSNDLERIQVFEKKLRIITGVEKMPDYQTEGNYETDTPFEIQDNTNGRSSAPERPQKDSTRQKLSIEKINIKTMKQNTSYQKTQSLYEKKIAEGLGLISGYQYTKDWSKIIKKSFSLAQEYASFDFRFHRVKDISNQLEDNINELDQLLLDKTSFIRSTPTLYPADGWITSYFGPRLSPYAGRMKMHEGLDVGGPIGTPIVAPADGVIAFSGVKPGFGNYLQIDHGYGVETCYGHNDNLFVKKGQIVKRGTKVATIGNTGYSTGPHLHYEVRVNGIPVDPFYFILN